MSRPMDENSIASEYRSASSDRRHSQSGTNTVSRLELRYPSRFTPETGKPANAIHTVVEEDHYKSTKNDRTVNYRKCICPFILGILLMFAGIALCTLEVEDREMPKIILPKKSKAPPRWMKEKKESRTQSRLGTPGTPNCGIMCFPSRTDPESKAVVELDELSTSTSTDQNNSRERPQTLYIEQNTIGEDNPAFNGKHEDTPC